MIRRLIIVARDEVDLYDFIRRDQLGDETVAVITDRRRCDRRRRGQTQDRLPDRRQGDRRRRDIEPRLLADGWAEVTLL
jgi:hypothetical protein